MRFAGIDVNVETYFVAGCFPNCEAEMANATAVAGNRSCSGVDGCCTAILQRPVLGYRITVEEHVKRNNVDSSVRLVTCNCSYSFFMEDDDVSEGRDDRSKYYDFSSYRLSGD